ncbi:hypothetical protein ACUH9O_08715 [Dermabacteraceae bacterium P13103]
MEPVPSLGAMVISPEEVPPFPVLTLTGGDDPENVRLDQQKFDGEDAYEQALQAAAARAAELGGVVRVRGVSADGTEWPMVMTADGQLHPLGDGPAVAGRGKSLTGIDRRKLLGASMLAGVGVMAIGSVGGLYYFWRRSNYVAPPPPPPKYPGKGANLPVLPPKGASLVAKWAAPIDKARQPQMLHSGHILVGLKEGRVALLDGENGQQVWSAPGVRSNGPIRLLTINGVQMISMATSNRLLAWRIDQPGKGPQEIELFENQSGRVLSGGSEDFFELPHQSAQYLNGTDLAKVDIPVGAVPAGAWQKQAIAVSPEGLVKINARNEVSYSPLDNLPTAAHPTAARVIGDNMATLWEANSQTTATLHDISTGTLIDRVESLSRLHRAADKLIHNAQRTNWGWGSLVIRPGKLLLPTIAQSNGSRQEITPSVIGEALAWAKNGKNPLRINLASGQITAEAEGTVVPSLISPNGKTIYVVADKDKQTFLYALDMS